MLSNTFLSTLTVGQKQYSYYDLNKLQKQGVGDINRLPYAIRVLVENVLRKLDGTVVREEDLHAIANWQPQHDQPVEIPFHPARVLMQDFTGVPAVVDLAAMRDAVNVKGDDPRKINPLVPVELIVDHSVQIDAHGSPDCLTVNVAKEYERNVERYQLLKWAQKSFTNFKVVPPNSGICHQVNLEYLGRVVFSQNGMPDEKSNPVAFPDTLVGTDSHTTMINGIGVLGWGVGGIEAEAVMLGQPYTMSIPEVVGVRLIGRLPVGVTATDLVLTITQLLRSQGVVEKIVEFFGPGLQQLQVTDRATIANMSPEYGATAGFFPIDQKTVDYLSMTNRRQQAELVEAYAKANGMFFSHDQTPEYSRIVDFDLSTVEPSLAGPARPQDRIAMQEMKQAFSEVLGCAYDRDADLSTMSQFLDESGSETKRARTCRPISLRCFELALGDQKISLGDGNVVIAAITSCTNTSNPHVMIGAGLIAKAAVEKGLTVPPYVKTSLAPGSRVVTRYLQASGMMPYLEQLGFYLSAYGCTTCIGNSGPLDPAIEKTITENELNVAAVLSGNRNFEARIHQAIKSNYLASPMLVVAYALAGRVDIDLTTEPLGDDADGNPVYLDQIWPDYDQIDRLVASSVKPEFYDEEYGRIFEGDDNWQALQVDQSTTFPWDEASTYIRNPPYFENFDITLSPAKDIDSARCLLLLGHSVTTDHISPAGAIPKDYPAGKYLTDQGVSADQFNSYGSRRGNHEVMMRGTFGNIRIKNKLVGSKEGSFTIKFPDSIEQFVYDAAMAYKTDQQPLIVIGGREYGTGSSRDWAAKGTQLLGVGAVLAQSFERIHRNNLVGMGVLPLVFKSDQSADELGLDGSETYFVEGLSPMTVRKTIAIRAVKTDGHEIRFDAIARLDTDMDVAYYENGGILPYVLRKLIAD